MDPSLERFKEQLRQRRCPASVLAKVERRIAAEQRTRRALASTWSVRWASAGLFVLAAILLVWWVSHQDQTSKVEIAKTKLIEPERAQVAEEAHLSLACLGATLIEAGNRTENIFVNQLKPRLLDGLEKAGQAFTN